MGAALLRRARFCGPHCREKLSAEKPCSPYIVQVKGSVNRERSEIDSSDQSKATAEKRIAIFQLFEAEVNVFLIIFIGPLRQ